MRSPMYKMKQQIEGQIQEIVFFGSLLISFSIFLSGSLYLALSTESLTFILGHFGATVDHALFSVFGYGFFYLAVMALHLGYVTNFHVFNFKDLKREYPVLLYSLFAHVLILSLFSTLLSVFQVHLELSSSQELTHGSGGFIGSIFGGHIYAALGLYGSVLVLLGFKLATSVVAGFFEISDIVTTVKIASQHTRHYTVKGAKALNASMINGVEFIIKGHDMAEATAHASSSTKAWVSRSINRANHIFTEHMHIYKREETEVEEPVQKNLKIEKTEKVVSKDSKLVVKKAKASDKSLEKAQEKLQEKLSEKTASKASAKTVDKVDLKAKAPIKAAKATSATATRSEKLMSSLKSLKKMATLPTHESKASSKKKPAIKAKAKLKK